MSRKDDALSLLDPRGRGLEIGAGYAPFFPKAKGHRVESVDHASADELRRKYAELGQDTSRIEEVDYVWRGEPLDEVVPHHGAYDYIFGSHVLEHLPDPVAFFNACDRLLKPSGVLVLIVPDKRYCFDVFRPIASTGDLVQAHLEKRRRHPPGKVFDNTAYYARKDGDETWETSRHPGRAELYESLETAKGRLRRAVESEEYIDVHGWQFVPSSFRLAICELHALGLTPMREVRFLHRWRRPEFYVSLSRSGAGCPLGRLELCRRVLAEQRRPFDGTATWFLRPLTLLRHLRRRLRGSG